METEIKIYREDAEGGFHWGNGSFPARKRTIIEAEVDQGLAKIIPYQKPEETQAEKNYKQSCEGIEINGTQYSATQQDIIWFNSIKDWVRSGENITMKFFNGAKIELTKDNIDEFEQVWKPFCVLWFADKP